MTLFADFDSIWAINGSTYFQRVGEASTRVREENAAITTHILQRGGNVVVSPIGDVPG